MALPQPKPTASFRKHVLALIGENYGDRTLCLCPTGFVRLLNGDHKAAILLSQILFWSERTKDPNGWFYKSYADWQAEIGLSEAQVRRIVKGDPRVKSAQITLRDLGVETVLKKVKHTGAPTIHYRINQERLLATLDSFMKQGDPAQCSESIPNIVGNEPPTLSGMNSEQCEVSSFDPETSTKDQSAEDQLHPPPTHHPDEDSDLTLFFPFESRFGLLKDTFKTTLREELARLGASRVGEVLDRCATRGRSWAYVLKALANEQGTNEPVDHSNRWADVARNMLESAQDAWQAPQAAPLPISERVQTFWGGFVKPDSTVQDAWDVTFHQIEMQFDRASFDTWARNAVLVDFDPEAHTFIVVAHNSYAREMLQQRLYRTVRRILSDIYGQHAEVQFLLKEEWQLLYTEKTKTDVA